MHAVLSSTKNALLIHLNWWPLSWRLAARLYYISLRVLTWGIGEVHDVQVKVWNNLLIGLELLSKPWDLDEQLRGQLNR